MCQLKHLSESEEMMAKKLSPQDMVLRIFIQPFVDRDTVIFAGLKAPEKAELLDFQGLLASCAEKVEIRGNS